jgi:ZIP family zinc transporter
VSGLAAAAGGAFVVLLGVPSPALLGHLLSFASGIMLYISYADLLPHAVSEFSAHFAAGDHAHDHAHDRDHGHSHGPETLDGFFWGTLWVFVGMLFFAAVVTLMPEMDLGDGAAHGHSHGATKGAKVATGGAQSAAESAAAAKEKDDARAKNRLWMTGLVAAVGISLHNAPEGLIVYNQTIHGVCMAPEDAALSAEGAAFSSPWAKLLFPVTGVHDLSRCFSRGLAIFFAIALHNIPEGMAVASPIFASTGSRWMAMKYTLLSGLVEPLAAIVFGLLFSSSLTPYWTAATNAAVAGIMICLCLIELIPAACEHVSPKAAALSNIAGQFVMFVSLYAMRASGVH